MPRVVPEAKPLPDAARRALVVVVDDSADVLESTSRYLTLKGFEVVTSTRGFGLTGLMTVRVPDVIVLDVMMPGIDGAALARMIRRHTPSAKIVFYSAVTDYQATALLKDHPGTRFVPKSRGVTLLHQTIAALLAR
jgi:two-component system cell cycle sensor histidine kinase/response regulator CckA